MFVEPPFILHSTSPVYKPPPDSRFLLDVKGPYGERCPYPEPFVTYLLGSPVKESYLEAFRTEPLQREMLHS
jgi:hypothetical protein